MSFIRRLVNNSSQLLASALAIKCASLVKLSFILGSQMAFFSGVAVAMPVLGAFNGTISSALICIISCLIHGALGSGASLHYLLYHIPGFCAAAYWSSSSAIVRLILPLSCMAAFIAHPIGAQAWVYSLYWLLPVVLYVRKSDTIFAQALGATFIAHAVGSVLWLYTVPMTPSMWLALIPIVAVERLLFATSMVVVYSTIHHGIQVFSYKKKFSIASLFS